MIRLAPSHAFRAALATSVVWAVASLMIGLGAFWAQAASEGYWRLDPRLVTLALAFATASYLQRLLRWHWLAARLAPNLGFMTGAVFGSIGFALTVTPGRAGEVMKLWLLQRHFGVSLAASAPILLLEKVAEGLSFLAVLVLGAGLLAGSMLLDSNARPWAIVQGTEHLGLWVTLGVAWALFMLVVARAAVRRLSGGSSPALAARLVRFSHVRDLIHGGGQIMAPKLLLRVLSVSVVARLCDAAALYWTARALSIELSAGEAMLVLGSAGLVGGLSLLPAGVGAVEATMVAGLVALGHDVSLSLSVVLLTRVFILWQWVALGLGLAMWRRGAAESSGGAGLGARAGTEVRATVRPLAYSFQRPIVRSGAKR